MDDYFKKVGYILAGSYGTKLLDNINIFSSDNLGRCSKYIEIVDSIPVPRVEFEGVSVIDFEEYRSLIYEAIYNRRKELE